MCLVVALVSLVRSPRWRWMSGTTNVDRTPDHLTCEGYSLPFDVDIKIGGKQPLKHSLRARPTRSSRPLAVASRCISKKKLDLLALLSKKK